MIVSIFKVEFQVNGSHVVKPVPLTWGLADIKDGFWVNIDLNLTNGSDCRYYVLSNHIYNIEKVPE